MTLQMTPTITAFESSPDRGQGLARDMRVRWSLEEVGQPYEVRLVSFKAIKEPAHLGLHPFGQIPTYEEGDLALFESGAIVFHIAERHAGLLPDDANARARAITWMFAALSTVEPPIVDREIVEYLEDGKSWRDEHMAMVDDRIRVRLGEHLVALRLVLAGIFASERQLTGIINLDDSFKAAKSVDPLLSLDPMWPVRPEAFLLQFSRSQRSPPK